MQKISAVYLHTDALFAGDAPVIIFLKFWHKLYVNSLVLNKEEDEIITSLFIIEINCFFCGIFKKVSIIKIFDGNIFQYYYVCISHISKEA